MSTRLLVIPLKMQNNTKKLSYQYICLSVCPSVCQPKYVKLTILKSKAWDIYRLYTNLLRCIWLLDVKRESLWLSADVVNGVAATVVVVAVAVPIVINFWIWPYFVKSCSYCCCCYCGCHWLWVLLDVLSLLGICCWLQQYFNNNLMI